MIEYIKAVSTTARWDVYRVLSEPVRLRLLALVQDEALSIGELAELLGESQPNVSRHAAPLRQAGLVTVRKDGTRVLLRLADGVRGDAVVLDALGTGTALCKADGSLRRVADVLRAREEAAREFFSRPYKSEAPKPPGELRVFLAALGPLLSDRRLAVDVGTGDGGLLEVLAPLFDRVIAVDRSHAQLARAEERIRARGFSNVHLAEGELGDASLLSSVGDGASVVFAVRILHHAPQPSRAMADLAALLRPEGHLVVLDYETHDDESMREQADVWLGFSEAELTRLAAAAGFSDVSVQKLPAAWVTSGPDAHLPWQLVSAKKSPSNNVVTLHRGPLDGRAGRRDRKEKGHG